MNIGRMGRMERKDWVRREEGRGDRFGKGEKEEEEDIGKEMIEEEQKEREGIGGIGEENRRREEYNIRYNSICIRYNIII